jgi:hypothetical protein
VGLRNRALEALARPLARRRERLGLSTSLSPGEPPQQTWDEEADQQRQCRRPSDREE